MGVGQEMDGCGQFMKFCLFFANFVIFIGGIGILSIGVWTLVDKSFMNDLLGTNLFLGAVYIMIGTGAFVALIAFFGCLGAIKEVRCMLLTYFIVLFLIFITMLVGGILGYVFRNKVQSTMENEMQTSIKLYPSKKNIQRAWDATQEHFQCCGVKSYNDWNGRIPVSCCKSDPSSGVILPCSSFPTAATIYTKGCLTSAETFIQNHAQIIGGTAIGVACLMLLGMIFSCALFKMIE